MNKNLLDEVNNITKGIIIYDVIMLLFMTLFRYLSESTISGLFFGSIIAALNLRLLSIAIQKSVNMIPAKAQTYLFSQYTVRMLISAVVLLISATGEHIDIISTVIGLLSTKFVILIDKLVVERIRRKEV